MARVTIAEVKEVIDTSLGDPQITVWIDIATIIITEAINGSSLVSTAQAKAMERLLVAHFIALNVERQAQSVSVGQLSESYASFGEMLKATTYGQTLLMVDPTGKLATRGKKQAYIKAVTSFA